MALRTFPIRISVEGEQEVEAAARRAGTAFQTGFSAATQSAGAAATAMAHVDEAARRVEASARAVQLVTAANAAEFQRVVYALDPAAAALGRYQQQQEIVRRAVANGTATQEEANRVMALAQQRYTQSSAVAATSVEPLRQYAAGTSHVGIAAQNASYQVTDFIIQVEGGVPVMRAAAQQLPQLLGGFGVWGAVAGLAAAGIAVLSATLFDMESASERATAASEASTAAAEAQADALDRLGVSAASAAHRIEEMNLIGARFEQLRIDAGLRSANEALETTRAQFETAFDTSRFDRMLEAIGTAEAAGGATNPRSARMIELVRQFGDLQDQFLNTEITAYDFLAQYNELTHAFQESGIDIETATQDQIDAAEAFDAASISVKFFTDRLAELRARLGLLDGTAMEAATAAEAAAEAFRVLADVVPNDALIAFVELGDGLDERLKAPLDRLAEAAAATREEIAALDQQIAEAQGRIVGAQVGQILPRASGGAAEDEYTTAIVREREATDDLTAAIEQKTEAQDRAAQIDADATEIQRQQALILRNELAEGLGDVGEAVFGAAAAQLDFEQAIALVNEAAKDGTITLDEAREATYRLAIQLGDAATEATGLRDALDRIREIGGGVVGALGNIAHNVQLIQASTAAQYEAIDAERAYDEAARETLGSLYASSLAREAYISLLRTEGLTAEQAAAHLRALRLAERERSGGRGGTTSDTRERTAALRDLERVLVSTRTAEEAYAAEVERLNRLQALAAEQGPQYEEAIRRATAAAEENLTGAAAAAEEFRKSLADAFIDGIRDAESFADALDNIGTRLLALAQDALFWQPLEQALTGGSGSNATGGSGGGFGISDIIGGISKIGDIFGGDGPLSSISSIFGGATSLPASLGGALSIGAPLSAAASAGSGAALAGSVGSFTSASIGSAASVAGGASAGALGGIGAALGAAAPVLGIASFALPLISGLFGGASRRRAERDARQQKETQEFDQASAQVSAFAAQLAAMASGMSPLQQELADLRAQFVEATAAAEAYGVSTDGLKDAYDSARAAITDDFNEGIQTSILEMTNSGQAALDALQQKQQDRYSDAIAAEGDLDAVERLNALEIADLWQRLTDEQLASLEGVYAIASSLRAEVDALRGDAVSAIDAQLSAVREQIRLTDASSDAYRRLSDTLQDALLDLQTGGLSTLSEKGQFDLLTTRFDQVLADALAGNASALQALPGAGTALLNQADSYYASSASYAAISDRVLEGIAQATGVSSGVATGADYQSDVLSAQLVILQGIADNLAADDPNYELLDRQNSYLGAIVDLLEDSNVLSVGAADSLREAINEQTGQVVRVGDLSEDTIQQILSGISVSDVDALKLLTLQSGKVTEGNATLDSIDALNATGLPVDEATLQAIQQGAASQQQGVAAIVSANDNISIQLSQLVDLSAGYYSAQADLAAYQQAQAAEARRIAEAGMAGQRLGQSVQEMIGSVRQVSATTNNEAIGNVLDVNSGAILSTWTDKGAAQVDRLTSVEQAIAAAVAGIEQLTGGDISGQYGVTVGTKYQSGATVAGGPERAFGINDYTGILNYVVSELSAGIAGVDEYTRDLIANLSFYDPAAALQQLAEGLAKRNSAVPAFAEGGYFLAGERGPELVYSSDASRIWTADETTAMLGGGNNRAVVSELREMKAVLARLLERLDQSGREVGAELAYRVDELSDRFDRMRLDGVVGKVASSR